MIQPQTILDITDNSGVKKIRCLKILGGFQKRYGFNGSLLCASVKKLKHKKNKNSLYKRGDLVFAIITQTRSKLHRSDGERLNFLKNSAIVTDKQIKPVATRILNPLYSEFRKKKYSKLLSLTSILI